MPVPCLICFLLALLPKPLPPPLPLSDLKTALVERSDFSSGTSSRSTKLIHGGVRYLQKAIMKLDYEQVKGPHFYSLTPMLRKRNCRAATVHDFDILHVYILGKRRKSQQNGTKTNVFKGNFEQWKMRRAEDFIRNFRAPVRNFHLFIYY